MNNHETLLSLFNTYTNENEKAVGGNKSAGTRARKHLQEIRNLQRSEIAEAGEGFDVKKQVGSSTMAHKKNPIKSENASGLARIVRSFIIPTYENALLWHERDLANSSNERIILPQFYILLEFITKKTENVFSNLYVNKKKMKENLDGAGGRSGTCQQGGPVAAPVCLCGEPGWCGKPGAASSQHDVRNWHQSLYMQEPWHY